MKPQPVKQFVLIKMHTNIGYPVAQERNAVIKHLESANANGVLPEYKYIRFAGSAGLASYVEIEVKKAKQLANVLSTYIPVHTTSMVWAVDVLPMSLQDEANINAKYSQWLADNNL